MPFWNLRAFIATLLLALPALHAKSQVSGESGAASRTTSVRVVFDPFWPVFDTRALWCYAASKSEGYGRCRATSSEEQTQPTGQRSECQGLTDSYVAGIICRVHRLPAVIHQPLNVGVHRRAVPGGVPFAEIRISFSRVPERPNVQFVPSANRV